MDDERKPRVENLETPEEQLTPEQAGEAQGGIIAMLIGLRSDATPGRDELPGRIPRPDA